MIVKMAVYFDYATLIQIVREEGNSWQSTKK